MFGGLLELEEVPVGDVMIHRTKMRLIDADSPAELVREAPNSPYSRIPLWRGDPENIIGMLHIKDLFRAYAAAGGDVSKLTPADIALDALVHPRRDLLPPRCRRSCAARPIRPWLSTNTASCSASSR